MGHRKTKHPLTEKITHFFKEAVEAPPEPEKMPEPEETAPLPELTAPDTEWEETVTEESPQAETSDVLDSLNSATQRWKETGDPGLHLEAPVPFSERAKKVWNVIAHDVSPKVAHALKNKIELVAHTANAKLHQLQHPSPAQQAPRTLPPAPRPPQQTAPSEPTLEQIDSAIIKSWMEVLAKTEEKLPQNEREEIEKLYKQLSQ